MIGFLDLGYGVHVALEHIVAIDEQFRTDGCYVYTTCRPEPFDCTTMTAREIISQITTALRGPTVPLPATFDAGPSGILPGYDESAE